MCSLFWIIFWLFLLLFLILLILTQFIQSFGDFDQQFLISFTVGVDFQLILKLIFRSGYSSFDRFILACATNLIALILCQPLSNSAVVWTRSTSCRTAKGSIPASGANSLLSVSEMLFVPVFIDYLPQTHFNAVLELSLFYDFSGDRVIFFVNRGELIFLVVIFVVGSRHDTACIMPSALVKVAKHV